MKVYHGKTGDNWILYCGDCREVMRDMPDASVDSVVCDPPYELGFMGKAWDRSGIAYDSTVWSECLRVLKPGGHLIAFGGSRTYHRLACAVEDAGFEIRDQVLWLYATGFPKNLNLGCKCHGNTIRYTHDKAISKHDVRQVFRGDLSSSVHDGEEQREVLFAGMQKCGVPGKEAAGQVPSDTRAEQPGVGGRDLHRTRQGISHGADAVTPEGETKRVRVGAHPRGGEDAGSPIESRRRGASQERDSGRQQAGESGSLQRPQFSLDSEPPKGSDCCKACGGIKTATGWGTALKPAHEPAVLARKPLSEPTVAANVLTHGTGGINVDGGRIEGQPWVAHTATGLGSVKFFTKGAAAVIYKSQHDAGRFPANLIHDGSDAAVSVFPDEGDGSAARYFYSAKADRSDREFGLEGMPVATPAELVDREPGSAGMNSPRAGAGRTASRRNIHPTVKPADLMRYLCKLITPKGGTVLDPFTGSGSTGRGALRCGFRFIGVELNPEYCEIAARRLEAEAASMPLFKEQS